MNVVRALAFPLVATCASLLWSAGCTDAVNPVFEPGTTPDGSTGVDGAGGGDASADALPVPPKQEPGAHASINPQPKVTECPRMLTAPATGTCEIASTGTAGKVIRGTILAPEEVLHGGEVLIDDAGKIVCAACDCSAKPGYAAASVLNCANGVVSPGLINTHDHISYANNKPVGHGTERFEHRHDWRKGKHGHMALETRSSANQAVQTFAELRFVMGGTTAGATAGGAKGLMRNVDSSVDDFEGLPVQAVNSDTFPLSDTDGTLLKSGCDYPSGGTTTGEVAQLEGYLPHLSEGVDVEAHNEIICATESKKDLLQRQSAVIHAVAVDTKDAARMRSSQTSVIWSPRSNVDYYGNTAPITLLDHAGVQIALGTDWMPSGSMNLLRELKCADSLNQKSFGKHFTDADIWRMVTINAAFAIGAQNVIGQLKAGYVADISIFDGKASKDFRAVIDAGVEDVALVLRGGKVLYGDDALLNTATLGGTLCESLPDVCGQSKRACVAQDIGGTTTLASIQAANDAATGSQYPLFFCKDKTPSDEPSCVPYREEYKDGVTADDLDGDGIANAVDNCADVFNPVRLMDNGVQGDADRDGIGDACDVCPDDTTQKCDKPLAGDIDGDGLANGTDNCPEVANPGQDDADADGHGDACDSCARPNRGATGCALTIPSLRNVALPDHPSTGTIVTVSNVTVTHQSNTKGFHIQSAEGIYAGMNVPGGPLGKLVKVGNKVTVTGVYSEIFSVSQITPAQIIVVDPGTAAPGPLAVTVAQMGTGSPTAEQFESMLLQIEGTTASPLTITNDNPDTGPFYEFVVTGNLRIDDELFTRFGTPATGGVYPPVNFLNGRVFTKIVGIAAFSFSNRKLWPRNVADFTP